MMPYEVGRWLTRAYYKASPTVVAWFEAHPWLKVPARLLLWLAIGVAWLIQASWKVQVAVGVSAAGLTMAFKLGVGSWLWSINLVRGLLAIAGLALASALFASSQAQAGDLLFFHNDHLGTAQVITDESQTVVWQGEQQPFGEVTTSVSSQENPTRLPGKYYDGESGLHYNYFRDYDPSLGRYVQSDPIGLQGGLNTYIYVHNNPIILIDVTGKFVLLSLLTTLYDFSYLSTSACFKGGCETSSVGFADCSTFQIGSKGFLVVGGTIADRTAAQYSMEDIFSTPRGAQVLTELESRRHLGFAPKNFIVDLNVKNNAFAFLGGDAIYVDPGFHPTILTTAGEIPATIRRIIAHELGQQYLGRRTTVQIE